MDVFPNGFDLIRKVAADQLIFSQRVRHHQHLDYMLFSQRMMMPSTVLGTVLDAKAGSAF